MTYFFGSIARNIQLEIMQEKDRENYDQTHFQNDMDDGKAFGFCDDKHINYADVISGEERITMLT